MAHVYTPLEKIKLKIIVILYFSFIQALTFIIVLYLLFAKISSDTKLHQGESIKRTEIPFENAADFRHEISKRKVIR